MGRVRRASIAISIAMLIMLFAAAYVQAASTQPQASSSNEIQITSSGDISALKQHPLTATQKGQIAEHRYNSEQQIREIQADSNLNAQQKAARIQQIQRQTSGQILSILTPEQRQELRAWQSGRKAEATSTGAGPSQSVGVGDFTPILRQHPLTASQKQRIISLRQTSQRDIRQINDNTKLNTQQKTARIQQIQTRTRQQVMNVLTPAQKKELAQAAKSRAGSMK